MTNAGIVSGAGLFADDRPRLRVGSDEDCERQWSLFAGWDGSIVPPSPEQLARFLAIFPECREWASRMIHTTSAAPARAPARSGGALLLVGIVAALAIASGKVKL